MIPSRGLRWSSQTIGTGRKRIESLAVRHFSSNVQRGPTRPSTLLSTSGSSLPRADATFNFSRTNILLRNGAGIRFASTTPLPAATAPTPIPAPVEAVSTSAAPPPLVETTSLDSATDFANWNISEIPESIGYLKSLGLEYGYGPTAMMEWLIEHIHIYTATPWWVSIALTAVAVRVVLFKPYIDAAENQARTQAVMPLTKPINAKMMAALRENKNDVAMECRQEIQRLHARAGIKIWKSFVPMLQAFAGFGSFVLLRAAAKIPVPGFETGGALWFTNLAIPDPFFILPIATAGVLLLVLKRGGETGASTLSPTAMKAMTWGFPALSLMFTWWLPAAVQVSFFVAGVCSAVQSVILQQRWFRNYFNMTPLPNKSAESAAPPRYKGTLRRAVPAPLSTTELSQRFEVASARGELQKTVGKIQEMQPPSIAPKKSVMDSIAPFKAVKSTVDEIKDAGKGLIDSAKDKMASNREKNAKKDLQEYERKRQTQIEQQMKERQREIIKERAEKKMINKNK